jgi:Asp-tRNA(Asn)/Glu-tRNA(Gln) amidotransferase A subunit family amidase
VSGPPDAEPQTAAQMVAGLAARRVSARELAERALAAAERWQPATNAFSQLWNEEALSAAEAVDRDGRDESRPLAGVPVAIKDLYDVAGHQTTGCCDAYAGRIARADAPLIRRVRAAGMVMVGKTNQHELAAGGTNLVSACGPTRNPWDAARMTGGSSGGSAAAVAAAVIPWALGSDTGGSIRIPSSFCGTLGLKPTTGVLPLEGLMPLAPSLDTPGPISSTVEDLWLLHSVLAGESPRHPVRDWLLRRPDRPFRIGLPVPFVLDTLHPESATAVADVAVVLESAGAQVKPMDGRGIEDTRDLWARVCYPEFAEAHPALRDPAARARVAPTVAEWLRRGEAMSADERHRAAIRREEIGRWFRERLALVDALLIPTTVYPAPRADQETVELSPDVSVEVARVGPGFLTCAVNLAGLPAISVPARWTPEGLPIGASLVGHDGGEETIARIAMRWEAASGFVPRRPSLPQGVAG